MRDTTCTSTRRRSVEHGLAFNHAYRGDPEIEKWLQNADFRRAVSKALDRDVFNDIFWLGFGTPSSDAAGLGSPQ